MLEKILTRFLSRQDKQLPISLLKIDCPRCNKTSLSIDYSKLGMVVSLFGMNNRKEIDAYICSNCKFQISNFQIWSMVRDVNPELCDDCDILGIGLLRE